MATCVRPAISGGSPITRSVMNRKTGGSRPTAMTTVRTTLSWNANRRSATSDCRSATSALAAVIIMMIGASAMKAKENATP